MVSPTGGLGELQRADKLTTKAASAIALAIVQGEFPAGAALPEIPLAKRLVVSRATVREALREVEALGLVQIEPHRGAFVPELSRIRAAEIFSFRAEVEGFAARLSMERASGPELVEAMERALQAQLEVSNSGDILAVVETDMGFHSTLSSYCGNQLLLDHLRALQMETRRFIFAVQQHTKDYNVFVEYHLPIVDAVKSGDVPRVEQAVKDHVLTSGERLLSAMPVDS